MKAKTQPKEPVFADKLPKKLVRLLRSVQPFIVKHPKQFDMYDWAYPAGNACQTVGCIAGHMAMKDLPKEIVKKATLADLDSWKRRCSEDVSQLRYYHKHLKVLVDKWREKNIPADLEDNFDNLFGPSSGDWDKFRSKAGNITPKLAVKRIDHFLKTGN